MYDRRSSGQYESNEFGLTGRHYFPAGIGFGNDVLQGSVVSFFLWVMDLKDGPSKSDLMGSALYKQLSARCWLA